MIPFWKIFSLFKQDIRLRSGLKKLPENFFKIQMIQKNITGSPFSDQDLSRMKMKHQNYHSSFSSNFKLSLRATLREKKLSDFWWLKISANLAIHILWNDKWALAVVVTEVVETYFLL